ncbi:MAG: hypothetical protein PHR35_06040, partial [Kiritimatiellae bacterium]|nr:hypothetical protein [Kiritimatiellia bacterium]
DTSRCAMAQVAFLRKRWAEARAHLEAPFWSNAEGDFAPWLQRREVDVAEAFALWRRGRLEAASLLLVAACEEMPQFGIGRYEFAGNTDVLYYRWRLAAHAGQSLVADTLKAHILRQMPRAGLADAAYAWRLARETGDVSAAAREAELRQWSAHARVDRDKYMPLREAVIRAGGAEGPSAWSRLRDDTLWTHRARFEMEVLAPHSHR